MLTEQYIITVEFEVRSEEIVDEFFEYVSKNAEESLHREPGCVRFDVLKPKDSSRTIFLYEIYENKEAFKSHLNAEHFKTFESRIKNLITLKTVREFVASEVLT